MKRQTLHIGGALLATTALSSIAYAGTIENASNTLATTTITAANISAQLFGGTAPQNITLGPIAYNIDFTNQLTSAFDIDIAPTGAKLATGTTVSVVTLQESAGSLTIASSVANCTIQVLTERILVDNCVSLAASTGCRIDVIQLSGVQFNQANGLATAGSSVSLSGIVTGNTGNQTFETISSATVITSANSIATSSASGGTAGNFTINNTATPPFSKIGAGTTAIVGTVISTAIGALSTNLTTTLSIGSNLAGGMEFTITHGVLSDAATTELQLSQSNGGAVQSVRKSNFVGSVASFNVGVANLIGSFDIEVNFNGSTAIQNWSAGSLVVAYTAGTVNLSAPTGVTAGALASFTQGGFRTQINTAQSSAVSGFDSFVRITNNGTVGGTAILAVANDATGSVYGSYTTATIAPNATVQVSMPTIEAGIPIATPAGQYMINVSGALSGYAQHVLLNTTNNNFVDLSGFRNGTGTNNP